MLPHSYTVLPLLLLTRQIYGHIESYPTQLAQAEDDRHVTNELVQLIKPIHEQKSDGKDVTGFATTKQKQNLGHRQIDEQGEISYKRVTTNIIMSPIQLGIAKSIETQEKKDVLVQDFHVIDKVAFPTDIGKGNNNTECEQLMNLINDGENNVTLDQSTAVPPTSTTASTPPDTAASTPPDTAASTPPDTAASTTSDTAASTPSDTADSTSGTSVGTPNGTSDGILAAESTSQSGATNETSQNTSDGSCYVKISIAIALLFILSTVAIVILPK